MAQTLDLAVRVRTDMERAGRDVRKLRREIDGAGASARRAGQGARSYAGSLDAAGRASRATGRSAGTLIRQLGGLAAAYFSVRAAASAVGGAATFETSLSRIVGLVGLSREEVARMREQVLALAGETGRAPQELAQALFLVTSAGARGSKALDILRQSARAATAGLGETNTVADAVTSAVNAYGAEVLDAGTATGILVSAVREGKVEASSLAPVLGAILPIAVELGVGFDQVAAGIAALSRTGLNAAEAQTALRGALVAILRPSQQAEKALDRYGLTITDLRRSLRERGLLDTLALLEERIGDNRDAIADIFPDVEGLVAVLSLLGGEAENTQRIFANLASAGIGDVDRAVEAVADDIEQKFNRALQKLNVEAIKLGSEVLPPVASAVQTLADNLGFVAAAAGAVIALRFGPAISGWGTAAVHATGRVRGLTGAVRGLNAAVRANPLGLLLSAASLAAWAIFELTSRTDDLKAAQDCAASSGETLVSSLVDTERARSLGADLESLRRQMRGIEADRERFLERARDDPRGSDAPLIPEDFANSLVRGPQRTLGDEIDDLTQRLESVRGLARNLRAELAVIGLEGLGAAMAGPTPTGRIVAPPPPNEGAAGDRQDKTDEESAAAKEIARIHEAAQERIAQAVFSRIALVEREMNQHLARLDELEGQEGVDEAKRLAARETVITAFHAKVQQLNRDSQEEQARLAEEAAQNLKAIHDAAIADIEAEEVDLGITGTYDAAIRDAERWRDATLASLDEAAEGYGVLADRVDAAYGRMVAAAEKASEEQEAAAEGWVGGMREALREMQEESESAAETANRATREAFDSMEDALVEFVRTGKLSFSDLVDHILAELARIVIRRSIIDPLMDILQGILSGRQGAAPGAPTTGGGFDNATPPPIGFYPVGHAGLLVGRSGGVRRLAPPEVFAAAPRYHAGGIAGLLPDEVPIIARRGEGVFTPEQMAALTPVRPAVHVEFINRGTAQREVDREVRFDGRRWVTSIVLDDLGRGGPIRKTLQAEGVVA